MIQTPILEDGIKTSTTYSYVCLGLKDDILKRTDCLLESTFSVSK